ncbi:MAG: DUF4249 domain-containing protein [Paludibacter sp.]|jgi:hypothetical protein|nr:DUF4249 domain-containing protein [Bacteroidales bacterium]HOG06032.1 DUF4249 domain-containing protein [Paludibacter sp.]HPM09817.1 DUF4249 domain-containing protein [Paludibacter sp.]
MKTIRTIQKIFLPILTLVYVATSCSETIEFEFNPVKPEIVVEGHVPALECAEVILSKTAEINSSNPQDNLIKNALVTLEDNSGISEILVEVSPGHYRSNKIRGMPGSTYKLTVQTNESEKTINSMDVMPAESVSINKLRARRSILPEIEGVKMPEWEVIVEYTDPAKETNYYRFVEYVNGKIIASYVEDDKLNNGKDSKSFLTNFDRQLSPGDTLTIEMQSISEAVYNYFYSFSYLGQLVQGSTKTNPITNINGAELGYFSAYASCKKSIVIE